MLQKKFVAIPQVLSATSMKVVTSMVISSILSLASRLLQDYCSPECIQYHKFWVQHRWDLGTPQTVLSNAVPYCQSYHERIIHTFLRLFQPLHTQQQQMSISICPVSIYWYQLNALNWARGVWSYGYKSRLKLFNSNGPISIY